MDAAVADLPPSFEGIHNFRDYGGYTAEGGRLVRGRLFRSGQHRGATATDLSHIARLGFSAVVDLRGPTERAEALPSADRFRR